jgi:hypothetical protein
MKIEIAQHTRMSERGSSLLRLIQNNNMPILDLLVRESIQNSLDAANTGSGCVKMEFNVGDFFSASFNVHLQGIANQLDKKFPEGKYKFLEIRDSNTTGLTGPLHYDNVKKGDFGNLLKLVYEISMPQQQEGAGGSWGLGKTVYFRIGIGLVIYYSRIKDEKGKYSSRLAACLVEDETKPNTTIPAIKGKPERGIAWWGQDAGDGSTTMPLTIESQIKEILKIFNVKPYDGEATGTTIIIPYLDEKRLLNSAKTTGGEGAESTNAEPPWWSHSVSDYIRVAVQRWYCPRLSNERFKNGRWLSVRVNRQSVDADNMLPFFKAIQGLYNRTPLAGGASATVDILSEIDCKLQPIALKKTFKNGGIAGYVSYCKITSSELLMKPPHNHPSPYVHINENEDELNYPIIMYTRKTGMIVGYETTGKWNDGIPKTTKDEYIIGLFVANSDNITDLAGNEITFNEYLRKSEKADHLSWTDLNAGASKNTIISRIQKQVSKNIGTAYSVKRGEVYSKKNISLGRALAEVLLPPEGFGSRPSPNSKSSGSNNFSNNGKNTSLKINSNAVYEHGMMKLDFELYCGKKHNSFLLELQILSEAGGIEAESWESDDVIGKPFPIKLEKIQISKVKTGKQVAPYQPKNFILEGKSTQAKRYNISINKLRTSRYGVPYGVKIQLPELTGYTLNGFACFSGSREKVQGGLVITQIEGN